MPLLKVPLINLPVSSVFSLFSNVFAVSINYPLPNKASTTYK